MSSWFDKDKTAAKQESWPESLLKKSGPTKAAAQREYQQLKLALHVKLLDRINLEALSTFDEAEARNQVREALDLIIDADPIMLNSLEKKRLRDEVLDEVFGLGPLEPLLKDASISDILVNTFKQVYVERGGVLELTSVVFRNDGHLMRIIDKIVGDVGRRVDQSSPMVDARLADGSRVNAIIPPLAIDGPILSIRRFAVDKLMPPDLVRLKAMTQGMLEMLQGSVKAKLNMIISGGTGSGKTTLLNALSVFIGSHERVITIEDAAELQLKQPHVVRLETRLPNIEGGGAVRQRELLINCLRMRPDRIVVGEVRGEEALDMLQAMNTGHDGSLTTVHANSPRDALSRLEMMILMGNANMPLLAIRHQIASSVQMVVQTARLSDGARRVVSIAEVTGIKDDEITTDDLFVFEKHGIDQQGKVVGRFAATKIRPHFEERLVTAGIKLRPEIFEELEEV